MATPTADRFGSGRTRKRALIVVAVPVALAAAFLGGCTRETDHEAGTVNSQYEDVDVGYMGGAYYLPKTFDASQKGYIEILRWDNKRQYGGGADKGGIAIDPS